MGNALGLPFSYFSGSSYTDAHTKREHEEDVVGMEEGGELSVESDEDNEEVAINTSMSAREMRRRRRLGLQAS